MAEGDWDPAEEERIMLELLPKLKEMMDYVTDQLPPGMDFGIILLAPNKHNPNAEGRVVAMTTNRDRVAVGVAQWVLNVLADRK
jgi:hypothetical protein